MSQIRVLSVWYINVTFEYILWQPYINNRFYIMALPAKQCMAYLSESLYCFLRWTDPLPQACSGKALGTLWSPACCTLHKGNPPLARLGPFSWHMLILTILQCKVTKHTKCSLYICVCMYIDTNTNLSPFLSWRQRPHFSLLYMKHDNST